METGYLTTKEFKAMVIKLVNELGRRTGELNENFSEDRKILKKKSELKNTVIKMYNTLEKINSRLDDAKEQIWKRTWKSAN